MIIISQNSKMQSDERKILSSAEVEPYIGKYYSQDWVRRKVLRQTDLDILEQDKLIEKEINDGTIQDPKELEMRR